MAAFCAEMLEILHQAEVTLGVMKENNIFANNGV
jgi:hypothetical protein